MNELDLEELYQAVILDHYKNPRCYGNCQTPCETAISRNPLCGDEVQVSVRIADDILEEVRFIGKGCAISQAATSLMAELLEGKTVSQALEFKRLYEAMILSEELPKGTDALEDAALLRGIKKFPARYRCALLPWQALGQIFAKE